MNFLNIKFLISVGIVILIALGGAGFEIWRLNGTIESLAAQLQEAKKEIVIKDANFQIATSNLFECNAKIQLQNAKFEALEAKRQDAIKAANKAKARFENLTAPAKNADCAEKLKFYEGLMNEASK
jgi:hypothetical protein|nr:MAG TPA: Protein of unknown function (DUF2681) [Caudoviricetes sp.]